MTPVLAVKPDWNVSVAAVPLKRGELGLELLVEAHRPGDRANRTRAGAVPLDRRQRGRAETRVVGQAEVVVRGQADQPPVVDRHDRPLGRAHDPERPVELARPEVVELLGEEGERVGSCGAAVIGRVPPLRSPSP